MNMQGRLRWDRTKNIYIEPVKKAPVNANRANWVLNAVQLIGGVKRVEDETGCVYEHIVKWIEQGYVNFPLEARILARHARIPVSFIPVACDSNDV